MLDGALQAPIWPAGFLAAQLSKQPMRRTCMRCSPACSTTAPTARSRNGGRCVSSDAEFDPKLFFLVDR